MKGNENKNDLLLLKRKAHLVNVMNTLNEAITEDDSIKGLIEIRNDVSNRLVNSLLLNGLKVFSKNNTKNNNHVMLCKGCNCQLMIHQTCKYKTSSKNKNHFTLTCIYCDTVTTGKIYDPVKEKKLIKRKSNPNIKEIVEAKPKKHKNNNNTNNNAKKKPSQKVKEKNSLFGFLNSLKN